jgi:hypothetical protein
LKEVLCKHKKKENLVYLTKEILSIVKLVFSCEKLKILKSWNTGKNKSLAKVKERGKKIMKDMAPYYNSRGAKDNNIYCALSS